MFAEAKSVIVRVIFYGVDVPVIITRSLLARSEVTVRFNIHGGKLGLLVQASTKRMNKIFGSDTVF